VHETDAAFIVTLSGDAFASGAATLSARTRPQVRVLATVLAGHPGHLIRAEGHADSSGDAAANQVLSADRAAAVRAALIAEGVDPIWITACGLGIDRPVASNETAAGRAANRRVEIIVEKQALTAPPISPRCGTR
jgi:OmpA-OmpF porin, OOP family